MPSMNPEFLQAQMAAHHAMELGDLILPKRDRRIPANGVGSNTESTFSKSRQDSTEDKRPGGTRANRSDEEGKAHLMAMEERQGRQRDIPTWMWASSKPSSRPPESQHVWQGTFAASILGVRRSPRVSTAPAVQQWQPRGHSFYSYMKEENPKKYSGKGVHSSYGGDVVCHPHEGSALVHVDKARDEERKRLEPGAGHFSTGDSMAECVLRMREDDVDAQMRGRGKHGLRSEGDYLHRMNLHGMFFASSKRIGHQAPGHALGAPGRWPKPKDAIAAEPQVRDLWGRQGERRPQDQLRTAGGKGTGRWRWHAENWGPACA